MQFILSAMADQVGKEKSNWGQMKEDKPVHSFSSSTTHGEGNQLMFGHPRLLKQLAQGSNYFGEEKIVFGHSNPQPTASELILGREGVDVRLQRHAGHLAHQMFEGMPQMDVVWDDDLLHDVESQDGLLQQVVGSGESLVDDELSLDTGIPMLLELDLAPIDVVPCLDVVWDDESIMSNLLMQNTTTSFPMEPGIAETDELQQDVVSHDKLLKLVAPEECLVGMDSETIAELVTFKVWMATKDDAGELFDETHCIAIWDEEPHHGFDSHGLLHEHAEGIDDQMQAQHEDLTPPIVTCDSLLRQLVFGKAYLDDEKNNLIVWLGDDKVLTHACYSSRYPKIGLVAANHGLNKLLKHSMVDSDNLSNAMLFKANSSLQLEEVGAGFGRRLPSAESVAVHFSPQCLNQDSKNTLFLVLCEEWAGQVLACNMVELNASEVLTHVGDKMHANLGMDGDCTSGLYTHANLLQQLAWGRVVFDYKMGESITETVLGDVLVTIDSDMQLSDQVCKSQLFVNAYLIEVKRKEAIISRRRWDPGIWSYLVMGLTLRLECMDFSDLSSFANQVMVQAAINPSLSEKRSVMHSNLLEKSVWEFNIEQGQKGTNFSSQERNYDSENLVTWEQMHGYDEVTPWRLKAISPQHFNTEIAWSLFSPWSKHTPAHKQQQLEIYRMLERQWDPGIHRPMLINTKSVLIIGSFWRNASEFMVKATLGICSSISSRDTTELCACYYKCIADLQFKEHHTAVSSLEKALGLQIHHHLSVDGNERTIVLKAIRLLLAPYVISWCTMLKYQAFKCQNLCSLYKFEQDETSHGEDILQASVLDQFLTWTVWRCRSQSDANCVPDLVLEDMIFGVLVRNLSTGKRCFSLLNNDTVCISVILSVIRPWDPGGVEELAHKVLKKC